MTFDHYFTVNKNGHAFDAWQRGLLHTPLSPLTWQRELWHIGQSKFGMNFFDKKLTLMYPKQYLSMNCKDNNLCWSFSFDMNKSSILLRYKNVCNNIQQWLTFSFRLVFSLQSIFYHVVVYISMQTVYPCLHRCTLPFTLTIQGTNTLYGICPHCHKILSGQCFCCRHIVLPLIKQVRTFFFYNHSILSLSCLIFAIQHIVWNIIQLTQMFIGLYGCCVSSFLWQ